MGLAATLLLTMSISQTMAFPSINTLVSYILSHALDFTLIKGYCVTGGFKCYQTYVFPDSVIEFWFWWLKFEITPEDDPNVMSYRASERKKDEKAEEWVSIKFICILSLYF